MMERDASQLIGQGLFADQQDGDGVPGLAQALQGIEQGFTDGAGDDNDGRARWQMSALALDHLFDCAVKE